MTRARRIDLFAPLRAILALCLIVAGLAGNAVAGPSEDAAEAAAAYGRGDYATVLRLIRPLANLGNVGATHQLGVMYALGQGVPQDFPEAVKWWRKAADLGHPKAQFSLAVAYAKGLGVTQDFAEAMRWARRAADQGDSDAQVVVGTLYEKGQGVPQDSAEAMKWFRYAVGLGNAAAMYEIGVLYMGGHGVAESDGEAVKWFQRAAEKGEPRGKAGIAFLYGRSARRSTAAKQYTRAIEEYGQAIRFTEGSPVFYNELAWLLATADAPAVRNGPRAVDLALKAGELSQWKELAILDTLAAAYARAGNFAKAIEWQEKAIGGPDFAQESEKLVRLRMYREGKAWPN